MAITKRPRPSTRRRVNTNLGKISFSGSMKNIPIPKNTEYLKKLIAQMEKVVKNMRWRAIFYLKDENENYKKAVDEIEFHGKEEKYGFKSSSTRSLLL